ncbi:MAG: J domain-containing protein [Rectinemataceae bacterium]
MSLGGRFAWPRRKDWPRILGANACVLAGLALGLVGGLFGLAVGALIGFMLDGLRAQWNQLRFLSDPRARAPFGQVPGLALALALGTLRSAELPALLRKRILLSSAALALGPTGRGSPWSHEAPAGEFIELLAVELRERGRALDESLQERMTREASPEARAVLASAAWAIEAEEKGTLAWEREEEIRSWLTAAGCSDAEISTACGRSFPGWESPWSTLGLEHGATAEEIRHAFRAVSKLLHPDTGGGPDREARFMKARAAYEELGGGRNGKTAGEGEKPAT